MNNPRFDYIGEKLPPLGFGLMRLPMLDKDTIDLEQVKGMVDTYMKQGMNYFDTAYMYHGGESERVLKAAVVERYPREAYRVADKMPIWECKTPEDMEKIFNIQLERSGLEYFDFYMFHALDTQRHEQLKTEFNGYEFMRNLKAAGKAKHIGFSFHGTHEALRTILTEAPELEFVQLQLNYYDWETVDAKGFYDIAMEFGVPVIVMEPVRGGVLSKLPSKAMELVKAADPKASAASWAMRFCGDLDGVMTVLSGMSSQEQMEDNIRTMKEMRPLTKADRQVLDQVVQALRAIPTVACTACKYCADCPQNIPIYDIFGLYNKFLDNRDLGGFLNEYAKIEEGCRADDCVDCGLCSSVCPQGLQIPELLGNVAELA